MRSLPGLKDAVESERIEQDSSFFHDVLGEMVNRLGFFLAENWFDLYIPELGFPGLVSTQSLHGVENAAKQYSPESFTYRQRYEKDGEYITVAAHHMNLCDLCDKRMSSRSISSNSSLGLEGRPARQLKDLPDGASDILPIDVALADGFIVKHKHIFIYSPRMIYDAIVKQDS